MKKALGFLCVVLLLFGVCSVASASTMTFFEEFLGGSGDTGRLDVLEGQRAIFRFDLTAPGNIVQPPALNNWADVFDSTNTRVSDLRLPTTDEINFDPLLYVVDNATLRFRISDLDPSTADFDEFIRILIKGESATEVLFSQVVNVVGNQLFDFTLDPAWVVDGELRTIALARPNPTISTGENDFRVKKVNLTVNANAVPEPATMLLVGSGLVGLVGFRRKFKK